MSPDVLRDSPMAWFQFGVVWFILSNVADGLFQQVLGVVMGCVCVFVGLLVQHRPQIQAWRRKRADG